MKKIIYLVPALLAISLAGCTTAQPVGQVQICLFASCQSSPVVDRIGNPSSTDSAITEEVEQINESDQKGENTAKLK